MQGTWLRRAFEVAVPEGFLTAGFQVRVPSDPRPVQSRPRIARQA